MRRCADSNETRSEVKQKIDKNVENSNDGRIEPNIPVKTTTTWQFQVVRYCSWRTTNSRRGSLVKVFRIKLEH